MTTKVNLHTTTLLLTRPEAASWRFAREAEAALGRFQTVIVAPLMGIEYIPVDLDLKPETEFAFTSENGVASVAGHAGLHGRRAWCVGQRTAIAARNAEFDAIAAHGNLTALVEQIGVADKRGPILHVTGRHQSGDLVAFLHSSGIEARRIVAYDQVALQPTEAARTALNGTGAVLAPVFSARSAQLLAQAAGRRLATLHVVFISKNAASGWDAKPGERVCVADTPDATGMIAAMGSLFDADGAA